MKRLQMEEAVSEMRELVALFEEGKLEPKGGEVNLKLMLRRREAWPLRLRKTRLWAIQIRK